MPEIRRAASHRLGFTVSNPRAIPSIEQLLQHAALASLAARHGRAAVADALRSHAAELRHLMTSGPANGRPETALPSSREAVVAWLLARATATLQQVQAPALRRVINATGVIVHTNLGRAPLGVPALRRVAEVASGYSNLEYAVEKGTRGRRDVHAEALLVRLTGAEAAVVVNNNAAATLLLLAALARGREVIVSRGELVEIGGGFRVPDIMAQSGAVLREVGATNRTRTSDYAAAIGGRTALLLRVHPSNFRIEGFTERPAAEDLVALGRRFGIPVAEDLGSGNVLAEPSTPTGEDTSEPLRQDHPPGYRAPGNGGRVIEPTVQESVRAGFDAICFSGDKLLGGPQAGIVVGRRAVVDQVRRHPLMRALRVDKLTYAALEGTLLAYASGRARQDVPVIAMLAASVASLRERAERIRTALAPVAGMSVRSVPSIATVGGGSAPGSRIPSCALHVAVEGLTSAGLEAALRALPTPVVARVERDAVLLDLRTVLPPDDELLGALLSSVAAGRDAREQA